MPATVSAHKISKAHLFCVQIGNGERILDKTKLTTRLMQAHCKLPTSINRKAKIFHPVSLFALPPAITTAYAISVANSIAAVKLIINPTLLHIEQKYRSEV